jgi:hypothetical protein
LKSWQNSLWSIGILLHKQATRTKHFDNQCIQLQCFFIDELLRFHKFSLINYLGYDQSSYDYFPKKDRIYYPDLSDIRRRRLAEIGHEKKNNKAVFKGVLISEGILMVRVLGNEVSTRHDMTHQLELIL